MVLICIIFNILILLLRSCSIFCEYFSARKELTVKIAAVMLPKEEEKSVMPFDELKVERP